MPSALFLAGRSRNVGKKLIGAFGAHTAAHKDVDRRNVCLPEDVEATVSAFIIFLLPAERAREALAVR
jgi:hypothetical protein